MKGSLTQISVVSTAEAALKKLKKAQIAVYGCKKQGAYFIFRVKDKDIEKVFAIFDKPCYNITVVKNSVRRRFLSFAKLRAGLFAGAAAFIALALFANTYVLKIEVSGSGRYLEADVRRIIYDEGAKVFRPFSSLNKAVATGRILALPQVTFCNIEKRGSVLIIDVQVDEEHFGSADMQPLVSDVSGIVRNIVAVCGTAAVAVGDTVKNGDTLIYAHMQSGGENINCIAAGYAEIECARSAEFFAEEDNEENLKKAYASVLLENEEILGRKHSVKPCDGGVIYVIDFSYIHRISINLT